MNKTITLGLVQHTCSTSLENNLEKTLSGIRDAAARGANLILLQELHSSLYFCQKETTENFNLAETIPGHTTDTLSSLAADLGIVIVASLFEKRATGLYHNTAVVLDTDKGIVGKYRKMHIPDDPGFYEKFYFTPGDYHESNTQGNDSPAGFVPINTSVGCLGVLVCWDQWFPEAARLMTLAGADILLYPTAIGWDPADDKEEKTRQQDAWQTIQRAHAIANGLPVAVCNRTGFESTDASEVTDNNSENNDKGIQFWGTSFIAGPQGEILAQAPIDEESTVVVSIDLKRNEEVRRIWPYLRDRRIDAYKDLFKRYRD
jgi:N-carbamoylputrescine amidase